MVPRCHKQALWKDRGRLFNHGIPEESQRDTHFVPLLLAHKFNCFTRTTRNLIQPPKTTQGSRWIYVRVCLWTARFCSYGKECVWVCVVLQMNSHNCYTLGFVYLQTYTLESMWYRTHRYRCVYCNSPFYSSSSLCMHKHLGFHL